jgi:alpha-D-glucose phosphate-specific phosphoglucomutase
MKQIKFGTDGWRAVIAKEYTFDNLAIVTKATARWMIDEEVTDNGVVIGYDARFLSRQFAEHSASIFAEMEIPVRISNSIVPTPAVSLGAKSFGAIGIVITASHNPPEYNGFKIKAPFGGPATPDQIASVEERIDLSDSDIEKKPFEWYKKTGLIREMDLVSLYLDKLQKSLDLKAIKKSNIKIAHDPMFGSGMGIVKKLLGNQVLEIHNEVNPSFRGIAPEPIEQSLQELAALIPANGCAVGLANDGDADRIGMFDEKGNFVDSHRILNLLAKYLKEKKSYTGTIVKTFSTTDMLDKQAAAYGFPLKITPIGFKYIAELIINEDVLVGGEESGGIAVKGHIPERDGIYIGLLITEMMVKSGKTLSELVQDLYDEFGNHAYYRNDLHTEEHKKLAMIDYCYSKKLTSINGLKVVEWDFTDGIKHRLEDGSWLLVRPSGTEPVLRIYAEAQNEEQAESLVRDATSFVNKVSA